LPRRKATKSGGNGKRGAFKKESKASFMLQEARYQKGDSNDQPTGNIYVNAKPRFGNNERFKESSQD
jgi:hypothetical protein